MTSRFTLRILAALVLPVMLAGCLTSVPLTSIPKLMRLDFLLMDFQYVRVGLRLPSILTLRTGDAAMIITTKTDGVAGETVDVFGLVEDTDTASRAALAQEAVRDFTISVWRVSPEDVSRLAAIQERSRRPRTSGPRTSGSVAIQISGACAKGPIPAGPVRVSSYLKAAQKDDYIPLARNFDLRNEIKATDWEQKIRRCET